MMKILIFSLHQRTRDQKAPAIAATSDLSRSLKSLYNKEDNGLYYGLGIDLVYQDFQLKTSSQSARDRT